MVLSGNTVQRMRIAVNGVAARPLRLVVVEDALRGKARTDDALTAAGELAIQGAAPLQFNAYKVPLLRNLVKRAIRGAEGT
jgi:xanthine dehydrogenase YagS FAD-binding subunit